MDKISGGRRAKNVDKAHSLQRTKRCAITHHRNRYYKNQPASGKHFGFFESHNHFGPSYVI